MKLRRIWIGILFTILIVVGCQTERVSSSEAAIRERCTPIVSVLQKNYDNNLRAVIFGSGIGGQLQQSGPVLSADQADRQITADRICRQWVRGEMPTAEYSRLIIKLAAASIATIKQTPLSSDEIITQDQAIGEVVDILKRSIDAVTHDSTTSLTEQKLRESISRQVSNYQTAGSAQLRVDMDALIEKFRVMFNSDTENNVRLIVELNQRIVSLQKAVDLLAMRGNASPNGGTPLKDPANAAEPLRVLFEKNSFVLSQTQQARLNEFFAKLPTKKFSVEISGFADASGSMTRNEFLSEKRSHVVRDFLIDELAIRPSRIQAIGRVLASNRFHPTSENRSAYISVSYE